MALPLLQELLQLTEDKSFLLESFVNLSTIDKGILKAIRTKVLKFDQARKTAGETEIGVPGLGRGSKVELMTILPSPNSILSKFMDNLDQIVMILKIDGKQMLAVVNRARLEGTASAENLAVIANQELFTRVVEKEDFDNAIGTGPAATMGKGNYKVIYRGEENLIAMLSAEKVTYVRKMLKLVIKQATEKNLEVKLMYITVDKTAKGKAEEK